MVLWKWWEAVKGKVFVSVDVEGLPFSATPWFMPDWSLFQEMRRVATRLTRVVAGVLAARGYRVVVADSHGYMVNIDPLELPRGVTLVRGFPKALLMWLARGVPLSPCF